MVDKASTAKEETIGDKSAAGGQLPATIGLVALVLYAAVLGLIVADQAFSLGVFPTPLERYLRTRIEDLGSADIAKTEAAHRELVDQWGTLAVNTLIRALDREEPIRTRVRSCLRAITGQDFGMDTGAWSRWWDENRELY